MTRWARASFVFSVFGLAAAPLAAQAPSPTGTTASFRGLDAAQDGTIWASGTGGTVLRSTDGGVTWEARPIAEARSFDLRDIEAISATVAYAMVAGSDTGRIYKTTDGGEHWVRQYDDTRKGIFLDALAFWDESHGVAMGDPMNGHFVVLRTEDGGATWTQAPTQEALRSGDGEAAFAASGTVITVGAGGRAWIGTGANKTTGVGRVLRSMDYGKTWVAGETPIPSRGGSTGVFSVAFHDSLQGVAVGGDYAQPDADRRNVAITADGGKTWRLGDTTGVTGYLSSAAYVPGTGAKTIVATGTAGIFASRDGGLTWRRINAGSYNTIIAGRTIVAIGDRGRAGSWPSVEAAEDKATPALQRQPAKSE